MIAVMWIYHIGLIALAYRVGRDKAAYGVVLFLVGAVLFQLFANGAGSFIDIGCEYYGTRARDC